MSEYSAYKVGIILSELQFNPGSNQIYCVQNPKSEIQNPKLNVNTFICTLKYVSNIKLAVGKKQLAKKRRA